jgi:acetyltransferase
VSIRNLDKLFKPASIAVIGASPRLEAVGGVLWRNLRRAGFEGALLPVNPRRTELDGVACYPDVPSLPAVPDLAVIATPPETVPGVIRDLGARGTKAAVIISAGFGELGTRGKELQQATLDAAKPYLLRLVGPNCVGVMVPGVGLDASFSHIAPRRGHLAFVSQSGAMITAVLDWAAARNIGFSNVVSLGDMADVDFGDMLDFLAYDHETRAILLYVEGLREARKFMSAARAAARIKPVLVVKVGRFAESAKAAASHTGALAGSDAVYDAAFRRAGMLRVGDMTELFDAVETLALTRPLRGEQLAILTNGGGPGVLATDALMAMGGHLAQPTPATIEKLNGVLPPTWSHGNPVDIIGDADGARYAEALTALMGDANTDAILVLNCPTALGDPQECARSVIGVLQAPQFAAPGSRPMVLTSWLGEQSAAPARELFSKARMATYETPDSAIRGYMHRVHFRRNQELLLEAPGMRPDEFEPDTNGARAIMARAIAEKRPWLEIEEVAAVLAAYGIPFVATELARNPAEAGRIAGKLGVPVAVKIVSRDILHKSNFGGVALDLPGPFEVEKACHLMLERIAKALPNAQLEGFMVQPMVDRPGAIELIVGVTADSVFGPIVMFGHGGTAVEQLQDTAIELPPLNDKLARAQMARTRVWRLLQAYRGQPAADIAGLSRTLVRVAQLTADCAEIAELDLNPLLADAAGVLAVDARIRVAPDSRSPAERLSIQPYPRQYESNVTLPSGEKIRLRPIRPEDESLLIEGAARMDPNDLRMRFLTSVKGLTPELAARLSQIDYARELALVALDGADGIGIVRIAADPDNARAEFSVTVRSDWKGRGLGHLLVNRITEIAVERGIGSLWGTVLRENTTMLEMCANLGFSFSDDPFDPTILHATRKIGPAA